MADDPEPITWLDPRCRINEDSPHDRLDAGPIKILHQKEAFSHTIEISPQKPGTPLGEDAHSMTLEMGGLEIEACYAVSPSRKRVFAIRIQYHENFGLLIHEGPMLDELPPCEDDRLDTA